MNKMNIKMKIKNFFAFVVALILCGASLQAQNTLKGTVMDAKNSANVPFATVAALSADSAVLGGAVSDDSGAFSLTLPANARMIMVSCVGYMPTYMPVPAQTAKALDVKLDRDYTMLDMVEVVGKAPVIEQQMDKLVMNVSQSAFAQGSNGMDLIRKAPGVSVDKDGNVLLNGQAVAVWIDGRPSQLDGKSLEALLRATDGSTIDKIEVIANPSAKYDAAGQGGIINIRTKRNFKQGFNGSLSVNGGMMGFKRAAEQGFDVAPDKNLFCDGDMSLNLAYRTAKTNTYLQVSEGITQMGVDVHSHTDIQQPPISFEQLTYSRYDANIFNANYKIGTDWFIDKKNTLGVIFTLPKNRMNQWADTNENRSEQMTGPIMTQIAQTNAETDLRFKQYMGNVNYTHVFNELMQREITANFDYMHNVTISDNPLENFYMNSLSWGPNAVGSALRTNLHSDNFVDVYSAKADWQGIVMGMFMMEAGAKWALSLTDNEMQRTNEAIGSYPIFPVDSPTPLGIETTLFDYTEHIGALYATLAGQLSKHITAKAGLRGEYTYAFNSANTITQNYFNLFPTLYAGYTSTDMMHRYSMTYTRRIQRPHYSQLNPFQNYIDAHTSNMGNPNLTPSFSDIVSLNVGLGQYVNITANYIHNTDVISYAPEINPETGDQVLFATNIGVNNLLGGSFTLSELPLGKHVTLMINSSLYDFHNTSPSTANIITGVAAPDQPYDVRSLYSASYACLTWLMPKDWKLQLDGFVSSPVTQGYMHIDWNYSANIALKKTAMQGRLLFSLAVNDLFRTMTNDFTVLNNGVVVSSYSQQMLMQKVKVGLQWNFGTAQKPLKHRNVGNFDESSRTGSNNALGNN